MRTTNFTSAYRDTNQLIIDKYRLGVTTAQVASGGSQYYHFYCVSNK